MSRLSNVSPALRRLVPWVLMLAAACLPFAARLSIDNRIELWLDPSSPVAEGYERFRTSFGSDEFVLIGYEGRDVFAPDALEAQDRVLERLEELPYVAKVTGLPSLRAQLFAEHSPEELRHELRATPFYQRFVLGEDDRVAGILVETRIPSGAGTRRELVEGVRAAAQALEQAGFAVHLVGPPALNVVLDEASSIEAARSFPWAFGLSVLAMALLFRCWRATVVACLCAGASILITLGVMGASQRPLNMVSSVLPSLLWVLGLAGAIHLLQRYRAQRSSSTAEAAGRALSEVALPCSLAALTTALGFGSLLLADMAPIRELGAFAAIGLLATLLVNLTLGPWLIEGLEVPRGSALRSSQRFGSFGRLATRHAGAVLGVSLLTGTAAALGCLALRVEADPLTFLPSDSSAVRAYRAVADRLTGYYALELVIDTPDGWLDPAAWPAIDRVARQLEAEPGIARVLSPMDLLRQLHHQQGRVTERAFTLPASARTARELVELYDPLRGGARSGLVEEGGRRVRLSALVRVMASSDFQAIRDHAERLLADLPPPLSGYATGIVAELVDAQLGLVRTQLRSFGLAFLTVFGCLALGFASLRLAALAMLPNLLPVLVGLATMALFRVPLDAATVMMASVALGIAVDDTVHVLHAVRRERRSGASVASASERGLAVVGPALTFTTATACIGFLALTGSSFVPIRLFGALSALAMVVAWLADLLLLPALLARSKPELVA